MPRIFDQPDFCIEFANNSNFFISYVHIYQDRVIEVLETAIEEENGSFTVIENISIEKAQSLFNEWLEDQETEEQEAEEERRQNAAFYNTMPSRC